MPLQSQMQVKLVFLVATLFLFQNHAQATAVFDSAFGTNGRIVTTVGDEAAARATIIQPDGKIIVVGDVQRTFFDRDAVLVRYNSNGTHDADFGNNGKVITTILNQTPTLYAVALQPDGKIVVAGDIQPEEGSTVSDFLVARFNSNGSLDANFGNGGAVVLNQSQMDSFSAVVVQPDGKIVAAGSTSQNNYEGAIARFNTDGTLDAGFGSGGRVFISLPNLSNERFRARRCWRTGGF
ncbi:MAG: delta-60 repeat domain-containing protein [Acidobacteriota bacterium]|nr:delta-60 repeat domain-containing protein [Acidobacteriota bacterium]